ncbi:MAG: DNA-processing protein DprA [Pseudohongiellaceae bacterium]
MLCTHFSASKKGDPTPLTAIEYGRFALWLKNKDYKPGDLFHRFDSITDEWMDTKRKITRERLKFLLGRAMAMGLALEKWQSAGIWFLTRLDPEYPSRLKTKLGINAPPILFCVGNKRLLNAGGLAIVGSREIDQEDEKYAASIARQAANEALNIVSGGARGVDEVAMLGALGVDGTALGILSNDLYTSAIAKKWRTYLKNNQLALVSPFYPEAPFQVGNAMGRNKYIYCLSDYALAVRSEEGKGGTWTGAIENLKHRWVPLFVKAGSTATGNIALLAHGASPLSVPCENEAPKEWLLAQLQGSGIEAGADSHVGESDVPDYQGDLPLEAKRPVESDSTETPAASQAPVPEPVEEVIAEDKTLPEPAQLVEQESPAELEPDTQYLEFVRLLSKLVLEHGEVRLAQLKTSLPELRQKQIVSLLDRATENGVIKRKGKNRTYVLTSQSQGQLEFFEDL